MQLLTNEDSKAWCVRFGIDIDALLQKRFAREGWHVLTLETPESFRRCASFSVAFSSAIDDFPSNSLCWMRQWGIDSPELEELGVLFWKRLRFGERADLLNEFPGHLGEEGDCQSVRALLILAMVNVWDCLWFDGAGKTILVISHDGVMTIYRRGENATRMIADLTEWSQPTRR